MTHDSHGACDSEKTALRKGSARRWLVLIVLFSYQSGIRAQEKNVDFKTLTSDTADAVDKLSKAVGQKSSVRVFDFEEKEGFNSELSHELATQFADSLQSHARHFAVLPPEEFQRKIGKPKISAETFTSPTVLRCYASDLGAAVLVEGKFQIAADGVMLWVTAWGAKARTVIFHGATLVPMTPWFEELRKKPTATVPVTLGEFATGEGTVWVNPQHPLPPDDEFQLLGSDRIKSGYLPVTCVHCPNPSYTQNAVDGKVQGTVLLRGEILSDGSVAKLTVKKGLVCGLTGKAIAAAAHWTFKPAMSPDGTPIAVIVPIEVTFQLY
jgi:hypothetical protein